MTIIVGSPTPRVEAGAKRSLPMDLQRIATDFVGSLVVTVVSFWLHVRLAGSVGRPGPASMAAFVLGWMGVLTALCTGGFLLMVALSR